MNGSVKSMLQKKLQKLQEFSRVKQSLSFRPKGGIFIELQAMKDFSLRSK
jgi:hypothetical protein